jgi:hypothetical protein
MSDENPSAFDAIERSPAHRLEMEKLRLEKARHRAEIVKWAVLAIGAVISFAVIDYGRLRLEQFRAAAENERELLNAYRRATEAPEPDVWKRKLNLILNSTGDQGTVAWAQRELEYIESFAELDTLYRETLKIASQLVEPGHLQEPERAQARARFNQLYWADLPYAGESQQVITAMIAFRKQLIVAESAEQEQAAQSEWDQLNIRLIELSTALRESTPGKRN